MKTLIIAISSIFVFSLAMAQPKYTSVYSTHNYKMPLNAKVAKENNLDKTQSFDHKSEVVTNGQSAANYKNSFSKFNTSGAQMPILPIEIVVNPMTASGNYKSNFKGKSKAVKVNEKPANQPVVYAPNAE